MRVIDKVEFLLKNKPVLRDSDKKLLLSVWAIEGLQLSDSQQRIFLEKCTPAESITRARRGLREEYPASDKIEDERFNKFKEYRNNHAVSWM